MDAVHVCGGKEMKLVAIEFHSLDLATYTTWFVAHGCIRHRAAARTYLCIAWLKIACEFELLLLT